MAKLALYTIEDLNRDLGERTDTAPLSPEKPYSILQLNQDLGRYKEDDRPRRVIPVEPPEDRGFFKEAGSLVARGTLGAGETWARALRTADPEGGIDWVEDVATSGIESLEETRAQTPFLQPTPKSTKGWRRWVSGGVESAVQSLVSRVPGTAAGALLGSAVGPPVGTVIGALIGYVGSGAVLFGVAEYDRAFEEAEKKGIPRAEAQTYAVLSGLAEGGLEAVADVIELFTFKLTKPLMQPAKKALKAGIKELFKTRLMQHIIRLGSIVTAETSTEITTAGVQAELARDVGLGDEKFWAAAKHAFGPAFVASTIFFGFGSTVSGLQRRDIAKSLKDTGVDKKDRISAVNEVYRTLKDIDPDLASVWKMNATVTVNKGESIDMGEDLVAATSEFRDRLDKTVEKEAPVDQSGISDNQGAIKDIATATVRKSRTAEVEGRRLKAEEEKIRTEEGQRTEVRGQRPEVGGIEDEGEAAGVLSEIIAEEDAARVEAERIRVEDEEAIRLQQAEDEAIEAERIRVEDELRAEIGDQRSEVGEQGQEQEAIEAESARLTADKGLRAEEQAAAIEAESARLMADEVEEQARAQEVIEEEEGEGLRSEIRGQRSEVREKEIIETPIQQPATPATSPAGKVAVTSPQVPSERQLAQAVEEGAPALEEGKVRREKLEVEGKRTKDKPAIRTAGKYTKEQLAGVVKLETVRERTGETITIEENAETALNEADNRIDAFKKLLECLSG